jgi:hypothetical protein
MTMSFVFRKSKVHFFASIILAAALVACGGGGDGPGKGYFGVTANLTSNGVTQLVTVCIDGIEFYDPASTIGKEFTGKLMRIFGLSGASNTAAGSGVSCREKFGTLYAILTVEEFNGKP